MICNGIMMVRTCVACPEQYDAYKDGKQVGYLRLRHHIFEVSCPDPSGELVYIGATKSDGIFDDNEREKYLRIAAKRINGWLKRNEGVLN